MSMKFFRKIRERLETRNVGELAHYGGFVRGDNSFLPAHAPAPHLAENLSTVFACVNAISSAVSALPALVYRKTGKTRQEIESGDIPDLIRNGPNLYQTWPEFLEMLVAQILLRGNGLIEIEADARGNVSGLRVIPWHWCNPQMLPSGNLVYDVYDQPGIWSPAMGKRRRLLQHEVIHIRDRSEDGLVGRSRLQRAAAVIHSARILFEFSSNMLENGLFPSVIMTHPAEYGPDQIQGIQRAFEKRNMGPGKAGKIMVIPGEFKVDKLTFSPEDAELLESRKFSTEELCRLFQVPPPLIQDYSHNTFTNSEQAGRWFAQFCLLPWVRKIEASFNRALFPAGDHELSLDMSAFDRGDPATRWTNHKIAADAGILEVNEIREIEGWGPKAKTSEEPVKENA